MHAFLLCKTDLSDDSIVIPAMNEVCVELVTGSSFSPSLALSLPLSLTLITV